MILLLETLTFNRFSEFDESCVKSCVMREREIILKWIVLVRRCELDYVAHYSVHCCDVVILLRHTEENYLTDTHWRFLYRLALKTRHIRSVT